MSAVNLNRNNFKEVVLNTDKPVLIDFWATLCGPCRMQSLLIEELSDELDGSAVIAKLNLNESPEVAAKFSVMSIPTLVIIKNRKTGVTPKATLFPC